MDGAPDFREVYRALLARFGPQEWWPGETPLEVCLGAVLTQNTNWGNAERALAALREATGLAFEKIRALGEGELARLVRPAGFFNQKAQRLRLLLDWLDGRCGCDFRNFEAVPTETLRGELLALLGIGPETADSILLYALQRPVFVVDAYTRRVAERHGWADARADYDELATLFTTRLPRDPGVYNELHALFVRLGKEHCRRRNPRCHPCPLAGLVRGDPCAGTG
jgi:endonuclease-3 related protein